MNAAEHIDTETGEVITLEPVEIAAETMLGDLMKLVVDELKAAPVVWQQMSEDQQDDAISRIRTRCAAAITSAVSIISTRGFEAVSATVDSVTFKDGVKAVLKLPFASQGAHQLADSEGGIVQVVFASIDEFCSLATAPKPGPDQADLAGIGEEYSDS